jgi:type I restriction enzyme S subunit
MEWKKVKLGEILNFRRGHDLPHSEMKQGDIPVAGSNGCIGFHNVATPIAPIITIGRSGNIGTPYYYEKAWAHNTTLYIDDFKSNNPKYLYYLLKTLPLSAYTGGSAVPTLNRNHIHPLELLHIEDKATQDKIVAILSSLDDKIENNTRINRNLEAQAQALFKSWFVDFEPWGGTMPDDWKEGSLYNYVDVIYGAPYQSALFNEHSEGLPLIRIRDLKTNSPQVSTTEILPNTEYIEAGDIVAGMDAEFSPYLWKGEKGLLNQRCCKFKANDSSISNYYVLFLVKPKLEYVQSYKTGTTVSHLGKADIDRFNVIIPPIEIVRKFSTQVDAMKELVVSYALESARLAALRDTLLPKLMKGEIEL